MEALKQVILIQVVGTILTFPALFYPLLLEELVSMSRFMIHSFFMLPPQTAI